MAFSGAQITRLGLGGYSRALYGSFAGKVSSSDNTYIIPKGLITFTGSTPTAIISENNNIIIPKGLITFTGNIPTIITSENNNIIIPKGLITFTGNIVTATVDGPNSSSLPKGTITFTGYAIQSNAFAYREIILINAFIEMEEDIDAYILRLHEIDTEL